MGKFTSKVHGAMKHGMYHQLSGGAAAEEAARKARLASKDVMKGQGLAMDYLKERGRIPTELHDAALKMFGGLYGLPGYDQAGTTEALMNSPMYKAMAGQIDQSLADQTTQEGSSAAARGLLGSGRLGDALAKYRLRSGVDKSNALVQSLSGLQGMANLQGYDREIADLISGQYQTMAQGKMGEQQTLMQGQQAKFNALPGFISSIFGMGGGMGGGKGGGTSTVSSGTGGGISIGQGLNNYYNQQGIN